MIKAATQKLQYPINELRVESNGGPESVFDNSLEYPLFIIPREHFRVSF